MSQLAAVFAAAGVLFLAVIAGLAVWLRLEFRRSNRLAAELDRAHADLVAARAGLAGARYEVGRLEGRLARLERDDATRVRRAGYVEMPVNGKRPHR